MSISKAVAQQVADLLTSQNRLTVAYTAEKILQNQNSYIIRLGENSHVLGAVGVKKVQWYQCEINHLSVHPDAKRQGIGSSLLCEAEVKAKQLGARIAQCTIMVGNKASEALFKKHGYKATVTFLNQQNGNHVTVYQKVLVPVPEETA